MDSNDHEEFAYALSSSCLDLLGHYVMRLDATWLTTPELLRITTYCLHLHALKLADCPLPTRVLSTLLKSLTQLSRLSLDIPLQDYSVDEEEDGGAACEQGAVAAEGDEASRGRIYHKDELGENEIMKAIETSAHPDSLDYLELTFQSSVRISVNAVCSLLRHQHGMRTLKLVDADIEELQPRRTKNKKKNKGDRRKKGNRGNHNSCNINNNGETSSTAASASATETSAALSDTSSSTTSGLSLRSTSPSNSDTDDSSSSSGDTGSPPPEREDVESFGLLFLSISSSHTSDSSLIRILERCPQLRALHLHSCDAITNQALKAVVQHCPQLESISLSSCKQLSTAGLDRFFREAVSPLVHVHLCDQAAVRDETLEILARQHGRSLLKLAVYFCALITEKGVKALLAACSQLRVFGLQAYGMTPAIFEQPWASRQTLEQLDLQGVFKAVTDPSVATTDFSVTAQWQDRQARIDGFALTKTRLMTLVRLKNLRLAAGGIGKEVLGGFGPSQRIEVLHLYGLQSTQVDSLPWSAIKTAYPYLRQVYCNVIGVMGKSLREELDRLNVELLASSSIPDLAFENNFDD
ncbi:hypothetical protein BGX33_002276 [Mortierella sp. NVP41]|nr:hypothetical protein BGX33_002276 [Mortierella sp. NVP41]